MKNDNNGFGVPSEQAAMMLSELALMREDDMTHLYDIGVSVADVLGQITEQIENPPPASKRKDGCEIIHPGFELFPLMRELKEELDKGELELESYLRQAQVICDDFIELLETHRSTLANGKVREHMRRLANVILVELEVGPVLNTMFNIIDRSNNSGDDGDNSA